MAKTLRLLLTVVSLISAAAGTIFLSCSSFSKDQLHNAVTLKVVVFTILGLLLGVFVLNARKCNSLLGKACDKHRLIKSLFKALLLGFASTVNFLIKYPRFQVQPTAGPGAQRNKFSLYSLGSFSVFAVMTSATLQQGVELGLSDFLLGLTMDASMEIAGEGGPSLWYMLGAYVYCASLIVIRTYVESLKADESNSVGTQRGTPESEMITVSIDALGSSDPPTDLQANTSNPVGTQEEIHKSKKRNAIFEKVRIRRRFKKTGGPKLSEISNEPMFLCDPPLLDNFFEPSEFIWEPLWT